MLFTVITVKRGKINFLSLFFIIPIAYSENSVIFVAVITMKKITTMGWTTFNMRGDVKQWFINYVEEDNKLKVLDVAIVKMTQLYAAVQEIETKQVTAFVFMLEYKPKDYYNFGYKGMDETVGPCIDECPERILKLLSPITDDYNGYAKNWRERCWARIEKKKKLRGNHVVKTFSPVRFTNGLETNYFKKIGKTVHAGTMVNNVFVPICQVKLKLDLYEFQIVN